jgi:hypothetical protein
MTIASLQFEDIGPKFPVEGPYVGGIPNYSFKPGTVVAGDNGAEFIFLLLDVTTGFTANQGDVYCWDSTMVAGRAGEVAAANEYDIGLNVGAIFFGGRTGDSTGPSGAWSTVFIPGQYGIWVQRAGCSLVLTNAVTNVTTAAPATIGGSPGKITYVTALTTKSNPMPIGSLGFIPISKTFTADTTTGSAVLLNASAGKWLQKGMRVTGSGIPTTTASPSTHIIDINGATITLNAAATATATGVTMTALTASSSATTLNASPVLTNLQYVNGFYPNQTLAGTGIPASTTIVSIGGNTGGYTITMSANATASASNISVAVSTASVPNYFETMLNWPYFSAITSA